MVPNRAGNELISHVQRIVLPDTTIMSKMWAAYNPLNILGYVHPIVNHSGNFVGPATGAHTQIIVTLVSL